MKIALFLLLAALLFTGCSVPCEPVLPAGADPINRDLSSSILLSLEGGSRRPGDNKESYGPKPFFTQPLHQSSEGGLVRILVQRKV